MFITALQQLQVTIQTGFQQFDPQCCVEIRQGLSLAATSIATAIANVQPANVTVGAPDFTAIAHQLSALVAVLGVIAGTDLNVGDAIDIDLKAIAAAIPPPLDLGPIAKAIASSKADLELPPGLAQLLSNLSRLPPELNSYMQGTPWDVAKAIADFFARITSPEDIEAVIKTAYPSLPIGSRVVLDWIRDAISWFLRELPTWADKFVVQLHPILRDALANFLHAEAGVFEPVVAPLVDAIRGFLSPALGAVPVLGDPGVDPDRAVAAATGVALTAGALGWVLSYAGVDGGEPLTHVAELLSAAVGYEELRDVQIGPLVREGIGAAAELRAKAIFRQTLPGYGQVADWWSRKLVPTARAGELMTLAGLGDDLQVITRTAAYGGLQPRFLIQLINTGLFTNDDLTDEMTFKGLRPESQARILTAAPYLATATERNQARTAIEAAYTAGLISDQELPGLVENLESNFDKSNLIGIAARWKKVIAITKDLETEYTTLFKGGVIDDATLRNFLAGIGLQPDFVDAVAGRAEAQANATAQRLEIRNAQALAKSTAAEERKAALAEYRAGKIDAAALLAALVASGLTVAQSGAWVALAQAQLAGALRWVYGLQLPPPEAAQLRSRVTALTDQRKKNLIDAQQYTMALKALGLPDSWINSLRGVAEAMVTPKAMATAVPIRTN